MSEGRFAKLAGSVIGVVVAIMKGLSSLGLAYMLAVAVPLAGLAVCAALLYFFSVRQPVIAPVVDVEPSAIPSAQQATEPGALTFVVDDLRSTIRWDNDDPTDLVVKAVSQIHVSNRSGSDIRLLKTRLVDLDVPGKVEPRYGNPAFGIVIEDGNFDTVVCSFSFWNDGKVFTYNPYDATVELTNEDGTTHNIQVGFRHVGGYIEKETEEPF